MEKVVLTLGFAGAISRQESLQRFNVLRPAILCLDGISIIGKRTRVTLMWTFSLIEIDFGKTETIFRTAVDLLAVIAHVF